MTVSLFALCEPAIRRPCPLTELSRVGTALRDSRQALTTNASTAAEVVLANVAAATGSPTSVHCQELMPLSCQPVDVD